MKKNEKNHKKNSKIILPVAAICSILLICSMLLTSCANDSANEDISAGRTIKIAYLPITHAMPLFVLNELAADSDNFNVELIRFGSWPDLMDALNGGHVDGASVLIQLAMASKEQGIDLRATALGHRDGNIVAVANYINSVQDLKGRTIAIPSPLSTHNVLLNLLLLENGLTASDVVVIQMAPTEMVSALAGGSISAYIVAEPFGASAVTLGVGANFAESGDIWDDSVCCALVFSYDFIAGNLDILDEFMAMYHEAGDILQEGINPITNQIRNISSRHLAIDDDTLELSLNWISFDNLDIREEEYGELAYYMVSLGLSQSPPQFDEFVMNSYIADWGCSRVPKKEF